MRIHWIILTRFRRRCKARIRRIKIGIWKFNQTAALISAEIFRSFNFPLYDVLEDQVDVEDRVNVSFVGKNTQFSFHCSSRLKFYTDYFFIIRNYPGWGRERNLESETLKLIKSKKERSIAENMESLRSLIPLFLKNSVVIRLLA